MLLGLTTSVIIYKRAAQFRNISFRHMKHTKRNLLLHQNITVVICYMNGSISNELEPSVELRSQVIQKAVGGTYPVVEFFFAGFQKFCFLLIDSSLESP